MKRQRLGENTGGITQVTGMESNSLRRWDRMVRSLWIIPFMMQKKLGRWISNVRSKRKHPGASGMVLDEDRIRLLDRIGMDWK